MAVAFGVTAGLLAADFALVWRRARAEWRVGHELSPRTGAFITALYLLTAVLGVVAALWRPLELDLPFAATLAVGGTLAAAGLALALPGYMPFASVRHLYGVDRGGLITGGVYRYSRNPQYAGLGISLLGASVVAQSGLALLVVVAYWLAIRAWLVIEEEHLHAAFGAKYDAYKRRAPRFLGRPS